MFKRLMFGECLLLLIISGILCYKSTEKLSAGIFSNPKISVEKKTSGISEIVNGLSSIGSGNFLSPSQLNEDKNQLNNEWRTVNLIVFLFIAAFCTFLSLTGYIKYDFAEIIKSFGYPVESYELVTSDGYIIEIQRIPSANSSHSPVLLQHGIACHSSFWAAFPPNESLGLLYMLSKAGFDCWLGNVRGSPYGSKHKILASDSQEFWDFGLEEMAMFDLSAVIDFILNVTQKRQLYYVGHSMGSTLGLILLSSKLEYNDKVKLFFAEAPIAYIHHSPSVIIGQALSQPSIIAAVNTAFKLLNIYTFPPLHDQTVIQTFCLKQSEVCMSILKDLSGNSSDEFSKETFELFLHIMTPNSFRTYFHYAQIYNAKSFQKYDYGVLKNLFTYGQLTPPQFSVELITSPTVFYAGLNDRLSTLEDIKLLEQRLPYHIETYVVDDLKWNHLNFFTAINSETILNKYLIYFLNFFDIVVS